MRRTQTNPKGELTAYGWATRFVSFIAWCLVLFMILVISSPFLLYQWFKDNEPEKYRYE